MINSFLFSCAFTSTCVLNHVIGLASIFAVNSIGYFRALYVAKCVSGPHVFCDLGVHGLHERGIDGSRSSIEFSCGMYWEYTSLCWDGGLWLLFLVYVWLSCRAVSAVVCIESIPAYAGVVVRGCHSLCMSGSLTGQLFSHIKKLISIL